MELVKPVEESIYLDHHATTPVLTQVMEAMSPYFCQHFGNANSTHSWGWKAERALLKATQQVAKLLNVTSAQVFFTSGATESLHWVITGWARQHKGSLILTSAVEHKATYGALEFAEEFGARTQILPVDSYGQLHPEQLVPVLEKEKGPVLLTLIHGNNEIGTINDLRAFAKLKETYPQLHIHVDGAQSVGKLPLNLKDLQVDFFSFSGHKIYAPKGVGVLIIKELGLIKPLFSGGGQQRNQRAGTTDVPSIVGLGEACQWAMEKGPEEAVRLQELRDQLISALVDGERVLLNGHPSQRLPNNVSLSFRDLSLDRVLLALPKVAFSSSSACSSGQGSLSHVLKAIGRSDQEARQTLRFGLGQSTTASQLDYVAGQIKKLLLES